MVALVSIYVLWAIVPMFNGQQLWPLWSVSIEKLQLMALVAGQWPLIGQLYWIASRQIYFSGRVKVKFVRRTVAVSSTGHWRHHHPSAILSILTVLSFPVSFTAPGTTHREASLCPTDCTTISYSITAAAGCGTLQPRGVCRRKNSRPFVGSASPDWLPLRGSRPVISCFSCTLPLINT